MIRQIKILPPLKTPDAVRFKLHATFDSYCDTALFWKQTDSGALLGMLDGHLLLDGGCTADAELRDFVDCLQPDSIFTTPEILMVLGRCPRETVWVLTADGKDGEPEPTDPLSSGEIYGLLSVDGLSLPDYPAFAVDYCRRLNHGWATVFAKREKGAAVTLVHGDFALLNGLASHQKGFGSLALQNVLIQQKGRTVLVCCRTELCGFYEKNGFVRTGQAAYWVKHT